MPKASSRNTSQDTPVKEKRIVNGYCGGCLYRKCQTQYEIEDGVVMRTNGHPDSPVNKGTLCNRGQAQLHTLYSPYRVKKPLMRTNPKKGLFEDPGWKEISWDEALSITTQKIKAVMDSDPRKFLFFNGFGGFPSLFMRGFLIALGSPNNLSTSGSFCSVHSINQITRGAFLDTHDVKYCNYVLMAGRSSLLCGHADGESRTDTEAIRERHMRMIKVDPRNSNIFSNGDWVPIHPQGGLAFFLAMEHVILHEIKTFDTNFVKNHTNAVFLINQEGDYVYGPDGKRPLVWDRNTGGARPFNAPDIGDFALEGDYEVQDVRCRPAFALIKERLKEYTPEWAEEYCDVPAGRVRSLANELVQEARIGSTIEINGVTFPYRPVCVTFYKGLTNHGYGHVATFAAMSINILLGAWDVPGGSLACNHMKYACDEEGTPEEFHLFPPVSFHYPPDRMDLLEYLPMAHDVGHNFVDTMNNPEKYGFEYRPEVALNFGCNLFSKGASEEEIEKALAAIPFMVSISSYFDEHTNFADVVLPEASKMETPSAYGLEFDRPGMKETNRADGARQALIEPMYDGRHADEIYMEMAERLDILPKLQAIAARINNLEGLDPAKKYSIKELYDIKIQAVYGEDWNFDKVAEKGSISPPPIPEHLTYAYYYLRQTGARIPLYNMPLKRYGEIQLKGCKEAGIEHPAGNERVKEFFQPVPHWFFTSDMPWGKDSNDEFDLNVVGWRLPLFLHDVHDMTGNPVLQEVARTNPYYGKVVLNPETARTKGLKDGDMVYVENLLGVRTGPAPVKTSRILHPKALGIVSGKDRRGHGLNPVSETGLSWNRLVRQDWEAIDPFTGALEISPLVRIYKV
ncbi:MAG: molybdopterin-dependent oxidoreductase [Deltaproteobacteria bacterium]|nr:molybdopterin-dependent oxidoreductase [Deltaproteobacteria bacterium]